MMYSYIMSYDVRWYCIILYVLLCYIMHIFKELLMYICVRMSIHWILLTVSKCAWDMSVTGLKLWKWAMNHQNKLFLPTAHEPSGVYLAPRAPTFHPWLTEERLVLARGGDHCWGQKTFYFNKTYQASGKLSNTSVKWC